MGVTAFDIELINKALSVNPLIKTVMELGSQNLYVSSNPHPPFASTFYESRGMRYTCVDLAGDNHALTLDLSYPIDHMHEYDLVTDFGTSEHVVQMHEYDYTPFHDGHINSIYPTKVRIGYEVDGLFYCWRNKHDFLKVGGIMINVNPKSGSWPGHGYHYLTREFYHHLWRISGYEILELGEHAAMGNTKDGWNVYCLLRKVSEDFPSLKQFKQLPIYNA